MGGVHGVGSNKFDLLCSCAICGKSFKYSELVKQDSWNGKWTDYVTPCCHSVQWGAIQDIHFIDCFYYRNNLIK